MNEISGISPIKFEAAQILFSSDVFVAAAIVISYDPFLFNSTALGIYLCKTSQLYNFKTKLGDEICSSNVNMCEGPPSLDISIVNTVVKGSQGVY